MSIYVILVGQKSFLVKNGNLICQSSTFLDDSGSPGGDITSKFRTNIKIIYSTNNYLMYSTINKPMYSTNTKLMYNTKNKPLYQNFHITKTKHILFKEQIINRIIEIGFL